MKLRFTIVAAMALAFVCGCQSGETEGPVVPAEPAAEGEDGPEMEQASGLRKKLGKPTKLYQPVVTKPAAVAKAPMKVGDAFKLARSSAMTLAKHPKLEQLMPKHMATLAELEKLSTRLDQIAVAAPKMGSKELGAAKADAQKIRQKAWEMIEAIADSEIDEAKKNYEGAKEQFKLAMRVLQEHMERQSQVIQKITS